MINQVEGWAKLSQEELIASLQKELGATEIPLSPWKRIDLQGVWHEEKLLPALHKRIRPEAPFQVLLLGHTDVVPASNGKVVRDGEKLYGPGVADMKGGLSIMLQAVKACDDSRIGFEILLNPDEEVGSPISRDLIKEVAKRCHAALVFEPSLPDGALVSERGSSANFTLIAKGKSAHVGRNFEEGKSAIETLARVVTKVRELGVVNCGEILGGTSSNTVAETAGARFNLRAPSDEEMEGLCNSFETIAKEEGVEVHGGVTRPAKPFQREIFELAQACGEELGIEISCRPSGGVCDGNLLAGLPTIDTLGARGDRIHSSDEFVWTGSLKERAELTSLILKKLASGALT